MTFISHVQAILREHGYNVLIAASNESYKQERENIDMMERCMVDGLLISVCDKDRNADIYRHIVSHGTPVVFFDRTVENVEASQVRLDDYIMSFFMVEQLIRSGCKQIVHIPGPSRIRNGYERLRGYRDALEKFHIAYNPDLVLPPALSADEGSQVMSNFLAKNIAFDAVFGFTETSLIGAKSIIQNVDCIYPKKCAFAVCQALLSAHLFIPQLLPWNSLLSKWLLRHADCSWRKYLIATSKWRMLC